MSPAMAAFAPRAQTLLTTLAAPPGTNVWLSASTTMTGASGETRLNAPPDVLVEHDVADDEDSLAGEVVQNLLRALCVHEVKAFRLVDGDDREV